MTNHLEEKDTPNLEPKTKHELVIGSLVNNTLVQSSHAGIAIKYPGEEYYVTKLGMFPGRSYYMVKNQGSSTCYSLYSRKVESGEARVRFLNKVGSGRLRDDLKTHLEMHFDLFCKNVYMDLSPIISAS